ncbi:hypothetical protein Hanom_Chr01g00060481 [Helianthus anomalus]
MTYTHCLREHTRTMNHVKYANYVYLQTDFPFILKSIHSYASMLGVNYVYL